MTEVTVHTLAARETVREIRESLSRQEPTIEVLYKELLRAKGHVVTSFLELELDLERIELWGRWMADLAGMIQQREKK